MSATLVGSVALAGAGAPKDLAGQDLQQDYQLTLADYVNAAPDMAEKAKELGKDLSKSDPAEKIAEKKNNGTKFEEPAGDKVGEQPVEGDVPVLVILAKYKDGDEPVGDMEGQVPADYYEDLIFGTEYNPYELDVFSKYAEYNGKPAPTDRTMQNVYNESSYGKVDLVRNEDTAFEWVELPKGASYYLDQEGDYVHGNVNGDAKTGEFIRDLLKAADEQVDFSAYAENGEVPNVFVIHEGTGAEFSRDPAQFWSHKWSLLSALYYGKYYETGQTAAEYEGLTMDEWIAKTIEEDMTYDGVVVNNYNIQPGIGGNVAGYDMETGEYKEELEEGPYPAQTGVYAHEFGHALGLPDFYDTDYSSEGVGNFSMMAGGSWMRYPNASQYSGNSPTNFDPYSKMKLGWLDPIEVAPEDGVQELTLEPSNSSQDVVKMEVPGSDGSEYFLFENLQQEGFNKGLSRLGENAHGLVAWHVDENIIANVGRPNNAENWMNKRFQSNQEGDVKHYGLSVLQADGEYDLEKYVNRGDEADFFQTGDQITPVSKNVHTGSYYFWKGNSDTPANSGIHVTDITENEDGTITAKFYYSENEGK